MVFSLKRLLSIILFILSIIAAVILTIGIFILIVKIQNKLFVPEDYLMWTFNYPNSSFIFIYELYLFFGLFYIFHKGFREGIRNKLPSSEEGFFKRNKKLIYTLFIASNIVLFYTIVSAVTVVTNDKIIDYSYLNPLGHEYEFKDIAQISSGVHGKKSYIPSTYSKGDFFYNIKLESGKEVDLTEVGEVNNGEHEIFIIEELDRKLVDMGIPKVSSTKNFGYTTESLDEIYTDKIRDILENTD